MQGDWSDVNLELKDGRLVAFGIVFEKPLSPATIARRALCAEQVAAKGEREKGDIEL